MAQLKRTPAPNPGDGNDPSSFVLPKLKPETLAAARRRVQRDAPDLLEMLGLGEEPKP